MNHELEWQTRKERIDKKLRSVEPAWTIIKYREGLDTSSLVRHAVEEYPTENGPADYALFVNGYFLGIIESKKVAVAPQNVLEQAKRYSRGAVKDETLEDSEDLPSPDVLMTEAVTELEAVVDDLRDILDLIEKNGG